MESILISIKKLIGIEENYTHFDSDIMMHINSTFAVLSQLGVGPKKGFKIINSEQTWSEFIPEGDLHFETVKTYIYLKVKMVFDPPLSAAVVEATNRIIGEYEWRLLVIGETEAISVEEENQNG